MTDERWFAVRCVFSTGWPPEAVGSYEERITLWRAPSFDAAIERAEAEAHAYADEIEESPSTYLGLAQAYELTESPGDGAEVFSLIRRSALSPEAYLTSFFDTGAECQTTSE